MEEREVKMEEARTVGDDVQEDLDLCRECAGTWKVACYGAWCPNSQFWEDFLEDGWEDGAYTPRACCLRFMCGLLFWLFAPIWCCKAILFFLFWPCICCCRAARKGHCNRDYFRRRRSKDKRNSQPLAYIESAPPSHPNEISYQFSAPKGLPESPIPEIRIETELDNGTYVTSPVEDSDLELPSGHRLPTITVTTDPAVTRTNGHPASNGRSPTTNGFSPTTSNSRPQLSSASTNARQNANGRQLPARASNKSGRTQQDREADPPPPYPMSESPGGARASHRIRSSTQPTQTTHTSTNHSSSPHSSPSATRHSVAKKTMSAKAKGMDNNLYKAVVMEGFQGITGKVTTV